MTAKWLSADEPFFREYNARQPPQHRSLARARRLQQILASGAAEPPIVTVVGSKGKGTAATCAAAALSSAGLKVGLITSPPFRTNRERIRIDGQAIDAGTYSDLARRVGSAIDELPPPSADEGYLSPTGCFTVAGMAHLTGEGCDVIVLEEGLGGTSDEVSLFAPTFLIVTPIFLEHVDLLGDDTATIACDLVGVATDHTQLIASTNQVADVSSVLAAKARAVRAELRFVLDDLDEWTEHARGLSRDNARVGAFAGIELAKRVWPDRHPDPSIMETVVWPGRLTDYHHGDEHWVVDAAIDARGATAALRWCCDHLGEPQVVLLCLPDIKDAQGVLPVFSGLPLIGVRVGESYLSYDPALWPQPLVTWKEARIAASAYQGLVLAVGTMSFVGEVLDYLDVDCDRTYRVESVHT